MNRGIFLVLEGIEGAGKTTQHRLLTEWMDELGIPCVATREPGGTEVGEEIREILLGWEPGSISSQTELFLMLAARASFVREVVQPSLERGRVVLADRYDLSTLAYQGYGRGLDLDVLRRANELATGGLRPELYLLLDLEVEDGLARRRREGKPEDRIEASGTEFLRSVHGGYRRLAERDDRVTVVDAKGTPDEVQRRLRGVLRRGFPETFPESRV